MMWPGTPDTSHDEIYVYKGFRCLWKQLIEEWEEIFLRQKNNSVPFLSLIHLPWNNNASIQKSHLDHFMALVDFSDKSDNLWICQIFILTISSPPSLQPRLTKLKLFRWLEID